VGKFSSLFHTFVGPLFMEDKGGESASSLGRLGAAVVLGVMVYHWIKGAPLPDPEMKWILFGLLGYNGFKKTLDGGGGTPQIEETR